MYIRNSGNIFHYNWELMALGNCCGAGVYFGLRVRRMTQTWDRYGWEIATRQARDVTTVREVLDLLTREAIDDMDLANRGMFVMVDAVGGEVVQGGGRELSLESTDILSAGEFCTYYVMRTLLEWQKNKDKRLPNNFEVKDMGTFINPNTDHELQAIQIIVRYEPGQREDYDDDYYDEPF